MADASIGNASSAPLAVGGVPGLVNALNTENYAYGTQAGASLSGATGNIFGGMQAGWQVTAGSYNVAFGHQAIRGAAAGSYNIALGYFALRSAGASANNNIALGQSAGTSLTSAINTVILGNNAGSALVDWNNHVLIGNQSGLNYTSYGTTLTGTTTSGSAVITMASTAGFYVTALITGAGIPGGATISSVILNTSITISANATASASVPLFTYNDASSNVAAGHLSAKFNNGKRGGATVAIGQGTAGGNGGVAGDFFGATAVGTNAAGSITSGCFNTAIGHSALAQCTTGGSNTAIGRAAGNANVTGGYGCYFGHAAGFYYSAGDQNICIGNSAGSATFTSALQTGTANIAIGTNTGTTTAAGSNTITIGSGVTGNQGPMVTGSNVGKLGQGQTDFSISGTLYSTRAINAVSNAAGVTLTTAQMLGGILDRSGAAAVTDTTPTAAALVAAMPGAEVGTSFELMLANNNTATLTLAAGAGVTLAGVTTVAATMVRRYFGICTNVTGGSEALTLRGVFSATQ